MKKGALATKVYDYVTKNEWMNVRAIYNTRSQINQRFVWKWLRTAQPIRGKEIAGIRCSLTKCYWGSPWCMYLWSLSESDQSMTLIHIAVSLETHWNCSTCHRPRINRDLMQWGQKLVRPESPMTSEWVIKFNSLSGDSRQWGPYKPCNHSLYIRIIIFPHIDNPIYRPQFTLRKKIIKKKHKKVRAPIQLTCHWRWQLYISLQLF